jgi:hypothetical protein
MLLLNNVLEAQMQALLDDSLQVSQCLVFNKDGNLEDAVWKIK